jgi:hypothetical protein
VGAGRRRGWCDLFVAGVWPADPAGAGVGSWALAATVASATRILQPEDNRPEDERRWSGESVAGVVSGGHVQRVAVVVGREPPAMSISYEEPQSRLDSGYIVIYSEFDPELGEDDPTPSEIVCLHCLTQDGDPQLGRGLDLARTYGRADYLVNEPSGWFVPDAKER